MKKLYLLLMYTFLVHGADHQIPNSYQGKPITSGTIYDLTQQASPLPEQSRQKLNNWFQKDGTEALLRQLLRFNFANGAEFRLKGQQDKQLIANNGLTNESAWNYVFGVPDMNYHVKIAGPVNRIQSALMERGIWPGQPVPGDIAQEVLQGKIPTYQTASRAAYFLILKEFLDKNKLQLVDVLPTHLVYYPGVPEDVSDNYAVILESDLSKNAQKITASNRNDISDDMLAQLIQTIIGAGLWSIEGNIFLDKNTNKLYVVDLEQPNNSAPKDFFHKDATRYYGNINAGLEGVLNIFAGDDAKLQLVRKLIESNPVVKSNDYNARYKAELGTMLNQKAPLK